ncbi:MAG: sulfotransferase domain-containing protein [bacterium]
MKDTDSAQIFPELGTTSQKTVRPNFFIVGAPKCATTSMHYYLSQHPGIFMSRPKEPFFFGSDLDSHELKTQTEEEYLSFFRGADGFDLRGESTVWYLYSTRAPEEIQEFQPDAKVIIMLRNPADAMYAMHSQFVFSGNEPLESFKEAVRAEERRKTRKNFDSSVYFPEGLYYSEIYNYSRQIKNYLKTFSREQIKILLLKDLKSDPGKCYNDVLEFLGAREFTPPDFEPYNSNCQLKSPLLREIVKQVPGRTLGTLRKFVPVQSCSNIWQRVKPLLVDQFSRSSLEEDFKKQLLDQFMPQIEELEGLINRNLDHWKSI